MIFFFLNSLYNVSNLHSTEAREANGIGVAQAGTQAFFGGWPVLENNPGGFFNASLFDLTGLTTGLFVGAGSTSIINAQVKNTETGFKLEVCYGVILTCELPCTV